MFSFNVSNNQSINKLEMLEVEIRKVRKLTSTSQGLILYRRLGPTSQNSEN